MNQLMSMETQNQSGGEGSMSVGAAHLASPLDGPGESFPQMQTSSLALDNTNSQFYMWEPANPTERADFEEDLIASTNENLYLTPLASKTGKAGFAADSSDLFRSSLFVDDFRPESLIPRRARDDEFELDLEMSDLLDEFASLEQPEQDFDIFADDAGREACSGAACDCGGRKKGD